MDTRNKAILIILLVIVVMASVFVGIVIYQYKANYNKMITHHETNLSYLVDSEFVNLARIYSARLKGFIRSNKSVVKAFADRDKPTLIEQLMPRFETFKAENSDFL